MPGALQKRVWTALVLVGVLFAVLELLPPWCTVGLLTVIALAGAWEWSAFVGLTAGAYRMGYVIVVAVLLWGAWRLAAVPAARELLLAVAVAWWLVALGWVVFAPHRMARVPAMLAGWLAIVPAWAALAWLRRQPNGAEWVFFGLGLVWVADIGAFFSGRRFGRHRLAPQVSPGKTWEGVLGAIAVSALLAVAGGFWFRVPLAVFLPLCLLAVAFSIVGDLTESLLKRAAGMKDSGNILPGHGGVMDRIDSLTSASPVFVLGLSLLGVVA